MSMDGSYFDGFDKGRASADEEIATLRASLAAAEAARAKAEADAKARIGALNRMAQRMDDLQREAHANGVAEGRAQAEADAGALRAALADCGSHEDGRRCGVCSLPFAACEAAIPGDVAYPDCAGARARAALALPAGKAAAEALAAADALVGALQPCCGGSAGAGDNYIECPRPATKGSSERSNVYCDEHVPEPYRDTVGMLVSWYDLPYAEQLRTFTRVRKEMSNGR